MVTLQSSVFLFLGVTLHFMLGFGETLVIGHRFLLCLSLMVEFGTAFNTFKIRLCKCRGILCLLLSPDVLLLHRYGCLQSNLVDLAFQVCVLGSRCRSVSLSALRLAPRFGYGMTGQVGRVADGPCGLAGVYASSLNIYACVRPGIHYRVVYRSLRCEPHRLPLHNRQWFLGRLSRGLTPDIRTGLA